jgi:hypothetical protein
MSDLDTAANFLQKMMTSDLNAIFKFRKQPFLACELEKACRRWTIFWNVALRTENDERRETFISGVKQQPIKGATERKRPRM